MIFFFAETQRKEWNNVLKALREVKIRTADKNLNSERAEDDMFSVRFSFGTDVAKG